MMIRFTKGVERPDSLTCVRDDGSRTWSAVGRTVGVRHDLIHYAVETVLGYREAFFGLVAAGRDIHSFGTKHGIKDSYPLEAQHAEQLVGLVQWPAMSGGPALTDDELLSLLADTCSLHNLPMPPVTTAQLTAIRAEARVLHRRWDQLAPGNHLDLVFPVPP